MTTTNDLLTEVRSLLQKKIADEKPIRAKWLVQEIVSSHTEITGDDTGWYQCCAFNAVRDAVGKVVREMKASEMEPTIEQQLVFDGFERLQRAYMIEREGEFCRVPIEEMTRGEFEAKREELLATATGCMKHADEIAQYVRERFMADAAE